MRSITAEQGHVLFTETLVGLMIYAGDLNTEAVPVLKKARNALLEFAEVTTGKEDIVKKTQQTFENMAGHWELYASCMQDRILQTIPHSVLEPAARTTPKKLIHNAANGLGVKLFRAAFLRNQ